VRTAASWRPGPAYLFGRTCAAVRAVALDFSVVAGVTESSGAARLRATLRAVTPSTHQRHAVSLLQRSQSNTSAKPSKSAKRSKPSNSAKRSKPSKSTKPSNRSHSAKPGLVERRLQVALAWLKQHSSRATREGMVRYAIPKDHALGVSMADIKVLGKQLGTDHELAEALWASGVYEARVLASFVADPARLTPREMDRWCRDFDSWAVCDALCFNLFDRSPHAWLKVKQWADRDEELIKRAAFALLWGLTRHDKQSGDAPFLQSLSLIEKAAADPRNFVKKAVSMALRAVGKRGPLLLSAALVLARRLAGSQSASARWVGRDALRDLSKR
jgi:3-methyladenine DNA glycosylase AlkD